MNDLNSVFLTKLSAGQLDADASLLLTHANVHYFSSGLIMESS